MSVTDAVVIGAGIFGSVLTRALRKAGLSTITVDACYVNAGSTPAACLMRPSWFTLLGKGVFDAGLRKLDELIGVQDLTFKTKAGDVTVHWCDPKRVLLPRVQVVSDKVTNVYACHDTLGSSVVHLQKGDQITASLVVIAAGIWTTLLLPEIKVVGQGGTAWLWPDATIQEPFIKFLAPYRQLAAFNRGDGMWVCDGMTAQSWTEKQDQKSFAQCFKGVQGRPGVTGLAGQSYKRLMGYRPYIAGASPCMFKQLRRGLWVATGGAKNGTLAAGWCADQLMRSL